MCFVLLFVLHIYRSIILGSVQISLETFENVALFLRLVLPSTLIRHENEVYRKQWRRDNPVISWPSFPQTQIQNDGCGLFEF